MKKLIKSNSFKSALIFLVTFLLVYLYAFRQVDIKLTENYRQRDFKGRVELHSILPEIKTDPFALAFKAHYSYLVELDGKEERINIGLTLSAEDIFLPNYQEEFKEGKNHHYSFAEAYGPIFQRAVELNPQLPLLKNQIKNSAKGVSFFENRKIKILDVTYKNYYFRYYDGYMKERFALDKKVQSQDLLERLKEGELLLIFEWNENEGGDLPDDHSDEFRESFLKMVQNGLPDGQYYLWPSEKIKKNDYKYLAYNQVTVSEGKVDWRR